MEGWVLSAAGYCLAFSTSLISGASSVSGGSTNSSDTIPGGFGHEGPLADGWRFDVARCNCQG